MRKLTKELLPIGLIKNSLLIIKGTYFRPVKNKTRTVNERYVLCKCTICNREKEFLEILFLRGVQFGCGHGCPAHSKAVSERNTKSYPAENGYKKCGLCLHMSEISNFRKAKSGVDGFQKYCKQCQKFLVVKRKRNISNEDFEKLRQKEIPCDICSTLISYYKNRNPDIKEAVVDHCHTTGQYRGVLCNNCNHALGMLFDSVELMNNAIEYIQKSNTTKDTNGRIHKRIYKKQNS